MALTGALGFCEWSLSTIRLCDVAPSEEESVLLKQQGSRDIQPDAGLAPAGSPASSPTGFVVVRPAETLPTERRAKASLSVSQGSRSRRKSSTGASTLPETEHSNKGRPSRRQSTGRENVEPGRTGPGNSVVYFLEDLDFQEPSCLRPGPHSSRPSSTGMPLKPGHRNPQVGVSGLQPAASADTLPLMLRVFSVVPWRKGDVESGLT